MAFHYIRDAQLIYPYDGHCNWYEVNLMLYHWLRVAGCAQIWECDSEWDVTRDWNHVDDGNMELAATTPYWNPVGGTALVSKSDAVFERGTRSLRVIAQATDDGVKTATLRGTTGTISGVLDDFNEGFVGPTAGVMHLVCYYTNMTKEFINGYITISGATNPGNNGTFLVKDRGSASTINIYYYNRNGVALLPDTADPTWIVKIRYEVVLWARNSSGVTWDVKVDRGDGSDYVVGTIPDNGGVWTQYHFYYLTQGNGAQDITISDPSLTFVTPHEIYIDSVSVFRSDFEYPPENAYGDGEPGHYPQDGELINPDRFKSASYNPGVEDVGRWLFIWDPDDPVNSGAYKIITDLGGGVVQVDLRSGSAAFIAKTGLRWRIVNFRRVERAGSSVEFPAYQRASGVGIESKHSSKWRLVLRNLLSSSTKGTNFMSAPEDTEIDSTSGQFRTDGDIGPSTQKYRQAEYSYWSGSTPPDGLHHVTCEPQTANVAGSQSRVFMIVDDDCSFVVVLHRGHSADDNAFFIIGYAGADPDHPGIEEFLHCVRSNLSNHPAEETIGGGTSYLSTAWNGMTVFDPGGLAVPAVLGQICMREGGDSNVVNNQANAGLNPWSGEEWLYQPHIIRDPTGVNGCPSIRIASALPVYLCRTNMTKWITFDSENYYSVGNGICFKWNGVTTLP